MANLTDQNSEDQGNTKTSDDKGQTADDKGQTVDAGKTVLGENQNADAGTQDDKSQKVGEKTQEGSTKEAVDYNDFTVPKDITLNADILGKFTSLAKDNKLSQESAQGLVDLASEHTQAIVNEQAASFLETRDTWIKELKADKEFGGEKFDETATRANRTLNKYGTPGLNKFLELGYGDNPEIIKMFARIDKALSEDEVVIGKPPKAAKGKSQAETLFGDMAKKIN